jgi:UPF0271 protein
MEEMRFTIDLNCDMGEGMDSDKEIMPYISSANIACGYHAGDEAAIRRTVDYCLQFGVAIGAHPGFDDKANFGRKEIKMEASALHDLAAKQINLVKTIAEERGGRLHHVKPHGALYNMAAADDALAQVLVQATKAVDPSLIFYGLSNSAMITAAIAAGLQPAAEVFADRTYQDNGRLTPRSQPGALITEEALSVKQVLQMAREGKVRTISGNVIAMPAETVCLHGDGAHAVTFAQMINQKLREQGIAIAAIRKKHN